MKHPDLFALSDRTYRVDADTAGVEQALLAFVLRASVSAGQSLVVMHDGSSIERLMSDLVVVAPDLEVRLVGQTQVGSVDEGQSVRGLRELFAGAPGLYVALASDLMVGFQTTALECLEYAAGKEYSLGQIEADLDRFGFERVSFVVEPGTFSVRGGILDVFPGDIESPLRLDFFGNTLESISAFDPASQRSSGGVVSAKIYRRNPFSAAAEKPLLDSIPASIQVFQYRPLVENTPSSTLAGLLLRDRRSSSIMLYQGAAEKARVFSVEPQPDVRPALFRSGVSQR